MRKLHVLELASALSGAGVTIDRIIAHHDVVASIASSPERHTIFVEAIENQQPVWLVSVIEMTDGLPILTELYRAS